MGSRGNERGRWHSLCVCGLRFAVTETDLISATGMLGLNLRDVASICASIPQKSQVSLNSSHLAARRLCREQQAVLERAHPGAPISSEVEYFL